MLLLKYKALLQKMDSYQDQLGQDKVQNIREMLQKKISDLEKVN